MAGRLHSVSPHALSGRRPAHAGPAELPGLEPPRSLQELSIPTVATKLRIPAPPRHLIQRGRLFDRLDQGMGGRLVVLSAPAGAGKTVLLSSWIRERTPPGLVGWLSLDADDNDAGRLLAHLLAALRNSRATDDQGALSRLTPPSGAVTERFLTRLVNALAELDSPLVLVLDEVHELTSRQAVEVIDFLARYGPEQCRLVLAGRADPRLSLERLRVSEELVELRGGELAFDRGETAELCARLELELSSTDVELLWKRTEGWSAALRLAALSLHGHSDPGRFLAGFAGTDHAVADYLISEVLANLSEHRREFMLRTSLVDQLTPELADSLTETTGRGEEMLAALEHSGAPLQRSAESNGVCCYRYHPLFRELLRAHLRHVHPEEVPLLHRRAARFYVSRGRSIHAIEHALAGEDWDLACSLIADSSLELLLDGSLAMIGGSIERLPEQLRCADARLAVALAGVRLQQGDVEEARRQLAIARRIRGQASRDARELLEAPLAAVALYHARLSANVAAAERFARKLTALARRPSQPAWASLQAFARVNLGATRLWSGQLENASADLREGLALATEHGLEQLALDCTAQLAVLHLLRGELTRGQELSAAAVEQAEQRGWGEGPGPACAYLVAGWSAYHRGEFERAEGLLDRAAALSAGAEPSVRTASVILQALVLAVEGPRSAARGSLKLCALRAAIANGPKPAGYLEVAIDSAEARVLVAAGELGQARATLASASEATSAGARLHPELLVRLASVQLCDGELAQAVASLTQALASPQLHPASALEAWLLLALVEQARGEHAGADDALDRALALAEHEPYRDAFLLGGQTARELIERQAQNGTTHPALLEVLLDGFAQRSSTRATLIEPLTEREQRILGYLPTMLSNAEIGAEIFVSLNTVKTHLRSVYRKLGASGRAEAVDRARELGLLPTGIKRPRVVQRRRS